MTLIVSCKKFVDIPAPATSVNTENAFKDDATATAILTGVYARLAADFSSLSGLSYLTELSADNLTSFDINTVSTVNNFYKHIQNPSEVPDGGTSFWSNTYSLLYTINTAVEGLKDNSVLKPAVKERLLGEAYFMRAFCYFYLTNLYGDVPLVLTTDPRNTKVLPRSLQSSIYIQINEDLANAAGLLTNTYAGGDVNKTTKERVRPNLASVYSLQARAFLYQKKYVEAEAAATKVIDQSSIYSLGILESVFLKNSSETIWALQPVNVGVNTHEAGVYLLPADGPNNTYPVYTSSYLMNSFEVGDDRKNKWMGSVTVKIGANTNTYPYPAKYKAAYNPGGTTVTEYTIVLRLAEQYLIRAEARNEQGNSSGAAADLNTLRAKRRTVPTVLIPNPLADFSSSLTQNDLRIAVIHERQVELFTEWGHRWLDLKRTGKLDAVMSPIEPTRGGIWESYKALYPIPSSDIAINPNLTQNLGYSK